MALRRDRGARNAKRRKRYAEDLEHRERRKAQHRAYYAVHKEQIKERQRRRSWAKKLSDFWRRLARFYGISREQYEALLAQQGGVCGICRKPPQEPLCVDHSHTTGRVRGLLCRKCNTALGSFDDDVSVMAAGIAYLRKAAADLGTHRLASRPSCRYGEHSRKS
jgi:Recombination endonuclease VII